MGEEGCRIAICGRDREKLDAALAELRQQDGGTIGTAGSPSLVRSLIEQGLQEEAIEQMRENLAAQATGTEVLRPHFLGLLAEALARTRESDAGLRVLDDALAMADRNGERYYQAELYRLKGELLLRKSTDRALALTATGGQRVVESEPVDGSAEGCFYRSIEIARRQKAKSLELRAVMSMARLYQEKGRTEEALDLLAPLYDRFTEGFDTKDLREAKALLYQLSND